MEPAILGVVLDSSTVITAERRSLQIAQLIGVIASAYGEIEISLSPVTIAELVRGIYRARDPETGRRRREYIEELIDLGCPCIRSRSTRACWTAGSKARTRRRGTLCR